MANPVVHVAAAASPLSLELEAPIAERMGAASSISLELEVDDRQVLAITRTQTSEHTAQALPNRS
jgi:hypothetical protein